MEAAQGLFLQRGHRASTLEAIADAADVAVRSVYVHFGDKAGLYSALLDEALELDRRYCDEGREAGDGKVGPLFGLVEGTCAFAATTRACSGSSGFRRRTPPMPAVWKRSVDGSPYASGRKSRGLLARCLRRSSAAKSDRVPAEATATFLWAAWDGVLV